MKSLSVPLDIAFGIMSIKRGHGPLREGVA